MEISGIDRGGFARAVNPYLAGLLARLDLDKKFVRASGSLLWDEAGTRYRDFIAGYGALPFGHHPETMWEAVESVRRSEEPIFCQPSLLTAAGELAEALLRRAPEPLRYVCYCNSGAETAEAAIKAARMSTGRMGIVSTDGGFHGKTLAALSATGNREYQAGFGAPAPDFFQVPYGDLAALEHCLDGNEIAGVMIEPIQGEGGVNVPPDGYLAAAARMSRAHGALFILDEVQTGLGRTGTLFACEAEGVVPDILMLAKALGGGVVPMGAILLAASSFAERFALKHSSTFAGNALGCRIALRVLERLTPEFLAGVSAKGRDLKARVETLASAHPRIAAAVRGRGLLLGLEFCVDARSFPPGSAGALVSVLAAQGMLSMVAASYLLNVHRIRVAPTLNRSRVLRIEPPLTVGQDDIDALVDGLDSLLRILDEGDSYRLLAHLARRSPGDAPPRQETPRNVASNAHRWGGDPQPQSGAVQSCAQPEEGRFAFLIHPIDSASFTDFDPSLSQFRPDDIRHIEDKVTEVLDVVDGPCVRIVAADGSAASGHLILVPRSPDSLAAMPAQEARRIVERAIARAVSLGAKVVGLGGFTSIATQGGKLVSGRSDIAVTTGNSYTVVAATDALLEACRRLAVDLSEVHGAIVGAGGSVGSATARLLAAEIGSICLVGSRKAARFARARFVAVAEEMMRHIAQNPDAQGGLAAKLRELPDWPTRDEDVAAFAERLIEENGLRVPLTWSTDAAAAIPSADVVVLATSSSSKLVGPDNVRHGAILCDLSRPSNVDPGIRGERPDVLVIDGGVIAVPGAPDLGWNFGFPRGAAYACMAETFMLALARHYRDTSIGADLGGETLRFTRQLSLQYGFRLADLRSFNRPLRAEDWRRMISARRARTLCRRERGNLNIAAALVDRHCDDGYGARPALHDESRLLQYDALRRSVDAACWALSALGVEQGRVVAVLAQDSIESVVAVLAAWRMGAVAVYLNPDLPPQERSVLLAHSRPNAIVADEALAPQLDSEPAVAALGRLVLREHAFDEPAARPFPPAPTRASSPAVVLYTSGSTGRPKGVVHTHGDLLATNRTYVREIIGVVRADILFSPSKLYFAYGLNCLHYGLFAGAAVVLSPRRVSVGTIQACLRRNAPSILFAVPTVYRLLLERADADLQIPGLRRCVSAGECLPAEIERWWRERFRVPIIDGIGTTEVLSTFISNRPADIRRGSAGRPVPGFEIRVLDECGRACPPGEAGVLWVRGPTVAEGYWRDPESAFFRNGWFNTNDIVRVDACGYYRFLGRANEMVKVGGKWVSPAELERCLSLHPGVAECAVVLSLDYGSLVRPKAYVVPRPDVAPAEGLAAELQAFARKRLADQYPHHVEFVASLPRTPSGKLRRFLLSADFPTPQPSDS